MWDVVQIGSKHLSHDMPCPRCGHPVHVYLTCDSECDCTPTPMPGTAARAGHFRPEEAA